jgi:hypothetical protein
MWPSIAWQGSREPLLAVEVYGSILKSGLICVHAGSAKHAMLHAAVAASEAAASYILPRGLVRTRKQGKLGPEQANSKRYLWLSGLACLS